MSCSGQSCECGCCAGTNVQTPQIATNPPGQPVVAYRVGTWSTFKESMLAKLSSNDYPALAALKTRSDDDFTIAFLDATAVVLDILTFYQERLVNESYLRTAGQLRSVTELSRLVGYEPSPGVSASTYLAFTLKQPPGLIPDPSTPAITIPQGTQVQSVPAQGQKPQTFETAADIQARPEWNALAIQSTLPWAPQSGDFGVYLAGTATQLQPGDLILVVGDEPIKDNHWDVRAVSTVMADPAKQRTWVGWSEPLGHGGVGPAQKNPKFHAFRQRAALFGYNSVDPHLLDKSRLDLPANWFVNGDWNFDIHGLGASKLIDLDATYPKIVPDGWIALIVPDNQNVRSPAGEVSLGRVSAITAVSRSDFGISAKISRVKVDTPANLSNPYYVKTRQTSVLVQSEELIVDQQPLDYPLYGKFIDLNALRPDLIGATVIAISGRRQKLAVKPGITNLQFIPDDGSAPVNLNPGDALILTQPSPLPPPTNDGSFPLWAAAIQQTTLYVEDASGRTGTVNAALQYFLLTPSDKNDPLVSEYALVASVNAVLKPIPRTQFKLSADLKHCYERSTATVNANVALATHGQSVTEILGNGNSSAANQSFVLKQTPLAFTQAPTPAGRQTTLQVNVNSARWSEQPFLYGHGPSELVFTTLNNSDNTTEVIFGDGVEGAVLATGQNNIQARYRVGSGAAGNVRTGALTTLMDRPIGVSGVTNPEAATGGQDAQSIDAIRANAPQTVLTLGRAVSITDYQDFASTFAGIAKAYAIWIPGGPGRGVFLTVAGVGGAALPTGSPTLTNLAASLRNYGNPLIPVTVQSYLETLFTLAADLKYDPAFDPGQVTAAVRQALAGAFSFASRRFGQGVSMDEVCAVIQSVQGIIAVNVTQLKAGPTSAAGDLSARAGNFTVTALNDWMSQQVSLPRPFSDSPSRICGHLPVVSLKSLPQPAEILVLHPDPAKVNLGVMS